VLPLLAAVTALAGLALGAGVGPLQNGGGRADRGLGRGRGGGEPGPGADPQWQVACARWPPRPALAGHQAAANADGAAAARRPAVTGLALPLVIAVSLHLLLSLPDGRLGGPGPPGRGGALATPWRWRPASCWPSRAVRSRSGWPRRPGPSR